MEPKVFVVDDDQAVRESIVLLFKSQKIVVEAYATAEKFLRAYSGDRPGCLVLDIRMPGMSGLELQQTLAKKKIRIPIIFVTGHGDVPISVRAIKAGAFDFIEKPFDNELLLRRVRQAIAWDRRYRLELASSVADAIRIYAKSIVDTVREPLLVLDERLDIISANRSFYDVFLVSEQAAGQQRFAGFAQCLWSVPSLRERIEAIIPNNSELRDFEINCDLPKVGSKSLLLNARRLQQRQDQSQRILLAIEDISERKQTQASLFEEKERAQVTLRSIGEAVITTDASGIVEYLNPIAEQLTGWTEAEARGQPIDNVFKIAEDGSYKPCDNLVLHCLQQSQICNLEQDIVLIGRNGQQFAIEDTIAPIRGSQGELLGAVIAFRDVTKQRRMTKELVHNAGHDALTGLVNRREFVKRMERAVANSKLPATQHVLCFIDLDQFKIVNDSVGHAAGDELLRQVASLFLENVRDRDTLARLGGDEFALLLDNCPLEKGLVIAEAIIAELCDYNFIWEGRTFQIGASIGLVSIADTVDNSTTILSQADQACYSAKAQGRNRVHVYQSEAGEPTCEHGGIMRAASLSTAMDQQRLRLYAQPMQPLLAGRKDVPHHELLVRLLDAEGVIVLPGAFIPVAERSGLMVAVDRWVIHAAFKHYSEIFAAMPHTEITINLSANSLNDELLPEFVRQQFVESGMPPEQICFEITETVVIQNLKQARRFITELKKDGCRFSLDNFGSGVSSFSLLKKLPVDYLKINGSFVLDMLNDPVDHSVVEAINKVGHSMGVRTIAKWVESDAIIERLADIGVDYAQGYAVRPPGLLEEACA